MKLQINPPNHNTAYGQHIYGWKETINHFRNHLDKINSSVLNHQYSKKTIFNEWLEKLLFWGDSTDTKLAKSISKTDCDLITFLHNPPLDEYLTKQNVISKVTYTLHPELMNNKILFSNGNLQKILSKIKILFVLSQYHKQYLEVNIPSLVGKVIAVHHPISGLTPINQFEVKFPMKLVHIGFWLRNFISFGEFEKGSNLFEKVILCKKEMQTMRSFDLQGFTQYYNIKTLTNLPNKEYLELITSSIIYVDLLDATANNTVLEAIALNIPIICRRLPSIEEYLGNKYPLYLDCWKSDINPTEKLEQAHRYLYEMDKSHILIDKFCETVHYHLCKTKVSDLDITWISSEDKDNIEDISTTLVGIGKTEIPTKEIINRFRNKINLDLLVLENANSIVWRKDAPIKYEGNTQDFIKKCQTHLLGIESMELTAPVPKKYVQTYNKYNYVYTDVFFKKVYYNIDSAENTPDSDPIIIVSQFFIHRNLIRHKEIQGCLRKNVENTKISQIFLLNEREYSVEELGINSEKIVQVVIGERLMYRHYFNFMKERSNSGCYGVLLNADIFLDNSISKIRTSCLRHKISCYSLLRYEFEGKLHTSKLFGPRADSQDTWIFHSSQLPLEKYFRHFDFHLGRVGCDNKLTFVLGIMNVYCVNNPLLIKTYHWHTIRESYANSQSLPGPYALLEPILT